MKKRMIALALSVLMLISLLPAQALAEGIIPWYPNADTGSGYNSNISGEAIFNAMMKQEEPDSFSEDTLTPYGTQKDEAFTILEKAEVFEYVANGGTTKASTFHDNLTENRYAVTGSSTYDMMSDLEGSIPGGLRFAQGVAFDPTGSGRRDHVAIIGFRYDGTNSSGAKLASFHLYIVDAESKKTVKHMTLSSGSAERYGNFINELTVVDSGNFDWAKHADKFPGLVAPDESYHGLSYVKTFGKLAYITKCTTHLMRDFGSIPSPFNAFLVNLGLESLHVRIRRHAESALKIAKWLKTQKKVAWVNYAGLPDNKYHKLLKKQFDGPAPCGVMTFGIRGGRKASIKFMDSLKVIGIVTHVADSWSCVLHPASHTHRQLSDKQLMEAGIPPDLIRLSVGLEDPEDLIADLKQALEKVKS